jgi:glycosyltransferase involved in cell wall biosynthesis
VAEETGDKRLKVLMLVPDKAGGIRRLFEHMRVKEFAQSDVSIDVFYSVDAKPLALLRWPWTVMRFWMLIGQYQLCHINVSARGSTLRKVIFALLCRMRGVPFVLHLHASAYGPFYEGLPRWGQASVRRLFNRALGVICLGQVSADFVERKLNVSAENVMILPNAVAGPDKVLARAKNMPMQLLFLGKVGANKGIDVLLEALAGQEISGRNWRLSIAGDGEVARYARVAERIGIAGKVQFCGWLDGSGVTQLLASADVLVLPSRADNMPLALLEGMAHGLTTVATPVGEVSQVIRHAENGILTPVGDVTALRAALLDIMDDDALRDRLGAAARSDFLALYEMNKYEARLGALYRQALSKPKRRE